ncbi:hypothetical protein Tco_0866960 [Tanacetum coccineum]
MYDQTNLKAAARPSMQFLIGTELLAGNGLCEPFGLQLYEFDDEIKELGEINVELEFGTHKLIEKLSQERSLVKEALNKFDSMVERDEEIKKLIQEKDSPDDFYCFMYDIDDDASISGKSSEHFGWDWPEKDSPEIAEEVMEMANDQAEALSDQEVADDCLDDEQVEKRRPSKRIRVTQEETVNDEKPKKG